MYCTILQQRRGRGTGTLDQRRRQEHELIHGGGHVRDEDISKGPLLATLVAYSPPRHLIIMLMQLHQSRL
jgi:hypothetical protein